MPAPSNAPLPCRHLSISVGRPAAEVYAFLADPANWPQWASGIGALSQQPDGSWIARQDEGVMKIVFMPWNEHGVLDHVVTAPDGREIHVPMRVIRNGDGAEVIFTLFRLPEMDDAKFAADAEWVTKDLERLTTFFSAIVGSAHQLYKS